jgi:D-lactate dehydrogenase (cytochrome)
MGLSTCRTRFRNEEGIQAVIGVLRQRLGDRLQTGEALRAQHAHTTTYIPGQSPDAVVFPERR